MAEVNEEDGFDANAAANLLFHSITGHVDALCNVPLPAAVSIEHVQQLARMIDGQAKLQLLLFR
jgi:hypothetical protein